jgi:hypothetical protein
LRRVILQPSIPGFGQFNGTVDRVRTSDQPLGKTFLSTSVQPIVRDLMRRQTIAATSDHNPIRVVAPGQIHNEPLPLPRAENPPTPLPGTREHSARTEPAVGACMVPRAP